MQKACSHLQHCLLWCLQSQHPGARQVEATNAHARGTTWLELLPLYRLRGDRKPIADPASLGKSRATLDKQVAHFKRTVRAVVARALHDSEDAELAKPGKVTPEALASIGFAGRHATLSLNIASDREGFDQVTGHLVKKRITTNKQLDEYLSNKRRSLPHELKAGRVAWDFASKIRELAQGLLFCMGTPL